MQFVMLLSCIILYDRCFYYFVHLIYIQEGKQQKHVLCIMRLQHELQPP